MLSGVSSGARHSSRLGGMVGEPMALFLQSLTLEIQDRLVGGVHILVACALIYVLPQRIGQLHVEAAAQDWAPSVEVVGGGSRPEWQ